MSQDVAAPKAGAPRVGLIASALSPNTAGERWQAGITYEPEGCYEGGIGPGPCGEWEDGDKDDPEPNDTVEWQPVTIFATYRCSALAAGGKDWDGIVRRRLEASREFQLGRELWTGDLAAAKGYPNLNLASPDADNLTEDGAVPLLQALACLEQYLADHNGGQQGMIHATSDVITRWFSLNVLRRDGARIFTNARDSIVVPGAGYDGSATNGAPAVSGSVWAYATDLVDMRLDTVDVVGRPDDPSFLDRLTNKALIRAEQLALVSWEGCRHAAVEIDVDVCDEGGS